MAAVQLTAASVESILFQGQFSQFRDYILIKGAAALRISIGHLHRFQIDIDQISLFLRKSE